MEVVPSACEEIPKDEWAAFLEMARLTACLRCKLGRHVVATQVLGGGTT